MSSINIGRQALAIHKKLKGKIDIIPKMPLSTKKDLSLFYTPGVGAVSSFIARHKKQVGEYTMIQNTVAVISDGSAVLGLGNIGPEGALPVMEGKAMLFKALAGVNAWPIVLRTQSTEEIIKTIIAISPGFGGINLEDIAAPRCFEIERRLRSVLNIPVFHDDQHGTAMVVLAGLLNALKVVKKNLTSARIVVAGAGAAGQAITNLLLQAGSRDIIVLDSKSIISRSRKDLDTHKKILLKRTNQRSISGGLVEALSKADVLIGVSQANLFSAHHIACMAQKPIVFALANPVPEIMPTMAYKAGAAVVATGRSDFHNQLNNSLGFPGIFRGALDHKIKTITDRMLIKAAHNLAGLVKNPKKDYIVPDMFDPRVVKVVAKAIQ